MSRGTSLRDSSTSARAVFEVYSNKAPKIPDAARDPHAWFSNPYVYILVATLTDLTTSRENGSLRIRRFIEECKERAYEYLIVLAVTEEQLSDHKGVVDRLRTELNLSARGRERLVTVPPAAIREEQRPITHLHHSPPHQDLLVRLRECVREGAEARVQAYEDEVSRSYLNRSSTSWLFAHFFALKEGMAFVFVQLGRRDMAIRFYDELHSTMMDRNERGNGVFCDQQAAAVAVGVTNPEARNYRALLLENSITELDMRTYLFARQTSLMLTDRKFSEVAERGLKFITALARRCTEEAINDSNYVASIFRDTWVFCTSRALAAALTPAIPSPTEADAALSVQLGSSKERHTARLIAGFHVHAMKAFLGLAQIALPGCLAPEDPSDSQDKSSLVTEVKNTSDEKLKNGLISKENAEALHSEIANAAASLYEMGGRARGAAALDGDAGIVRLRNESFKEAETLLSAQCSRYSNDNGWDDLHKRQRIQLARAEKQLDRVQEYLVSCLTMLYMCRESRRLWKRNPLEPDEEEDRKNEEDAAYWAAEAVSVSSRLPLVMKSKADRLFTISVLPNNQLWVEGDPGTAIVRIVSDIPTTIAVDSVVVECRHTETSTTGQAKSAIRNRDGSKISDTSPYNAANAEIENDAHTSTSSADPTSVSSGPGVLLLDSRKPIVLQSGVNDVMVSADEVPQSGRYKVTLVAIFVGNLKLSQAAGRISTTPIVSTKGAIGSRMSSISTSSSFGDPIKGVVCFPMIFSAPRSPSAFMQLVEKQRKLFLAPQSVQFVSVKLISGQFGIKKGAKLSCALLFASTRSRLTTADQFVSFLDTSSTAFKNATSASGPTILRIRPITDGTDASHSDGEAILQEELVAGEELDARVAVVLHSECTKFLDPNMNLDAADRNCMLQLQLSCYENDSTCTRRFMCSAESRLSFTSPLEILARIELSSDWGDEEVSRTVGLDGIPLGEGGTLICTARQKGTSNVTVSIQSASLETPAWLELRPDEPPVHQELLPCSLGHGSLFTFAFDVLTRHETPQQPHYHVGGKEEHEKMFEENTPERRLSRAIASSPCGEENQDDISQWPLEGQKKMLKSETTEGNETWSEEAVSRGTASSAPTGEERAKQAECVPGSGEVTVPTYDQNQTAVHSKEAREVVDLSATQDDSNQLAGAIPLQSTNTTNNDELATFKIELCIDGQGGRIETVLERKICMTAFRRVQRRYRIERSIKNVGDAGTMMELQFAVLMTGSSGHTSHADTSEYEDSSETQTLQYEVDADPAVWLVVGRRRGRLNIMNGRTTSGSAKMIPVQCGRQRTPLIRLFTVEGRGLALSRYENANEYMQVTVMPCRTVTSACSAKEATLANDFETDFQLSQVVGKSNMPEVIASDSFFGS